MLRHNTSPLAKVSTGESASERDVVLFQQKALLLSDSLNDAVDD